MTAQESLEDRLPGVITLMGSIAGSWPPPAWLHWVVLTCVSVGGQLRSTNGDRGEQGSQPAYLLLFLVFAVVRTADVVAGGGRLGLCGVPGILVPSRLKTLVLEARHLSLEECPHHVP